MSRWLKTWLPLPAMLLMATIAMAYPHYIEDEFEEMKRYLEHQKQQEVFPGQQQGSYGDYYNRPVETDNQELGPVEEEEDLVPTMEEVDRWPEEYVSLSIGQVAGVAVDKEKNVHVFHRGHRVWENDTFDENNVYTKKHEGPIIAGAIAVLDQLDGKVLRRWGFKTFYMPHGITLDKEGNTWLTDVAMHQVFKYPPKSTQPSLVLGKAFEPAKDNNDPERFCKPTDVAVASNGDFFVADGYCNSRVLKYSKDGKLLAQIGEEDDFDVAHSLALAEDLDVLCIADRDNERIVCVNAGLREPEKFGQFFRQYTKGPAGRYHFDLDSIGRVFGLAYSGKEGFLYVVGESSLRQMPHAFTIDLWERDQFHDDIVSDWTPSNDPLQNNFFGPHDIDVSDDGEVGYVGFIDNDSENMNGRKVMKIVAAVDEFDDEEEEELEEE